MKKCGVKPGLFKEYKFEDHVWYKNPEVGKFYLSMADRCVIVKNKYWMKMVNSDVWVNRDDKTMAMKEANSKWLNGTIGNKTMTAKAIKTFFDGVDVQTIDDKVVPVQIGSCPILDGRTVIPFAPTYITTNGKTQLNTWVDESLSGDKEYLSQGLIVLRLIYRSLCNGPELHYDVKKETEMLLEQILTDNYTSVDFRFVMNWLAANVQTPGINLLTNLWFCGTLEGIGKGTLVNVMKLIIGANMCGKLNKTEVEAGWTDHLLGKSLIEVNELDVHGKSSKMNGRDWSVWIKTYCNEETVTFRERNVGDHVVINIGNYIFTTNDENPVYLDKTDRRNQMIKTTDDPYWVAYASEVNVQLLNKDNIKVAKGFAWILEQVKVDLPFISKAHLNEFKVGIQNVSNNEVEEWIKTDITIDRDKWVKASTLYGDFKKWCADARPGKEILTQNMWSRYMTKCDKLGVTKRVKADCAEYMLEKKVFAPVVNREAVAKEIAEQCSIDVDYKDYDVKVNPILVDVTRVSSMDKMRAALIKMNAGEYDPQ